MKIDGRKLANFHKAHFALFLLGILTALFIGWADISVAQISAGFNGGAANRSDLSQVSPDQVPEHGTFYSFQNWPPRPYDWEPELPVYSLGDGNFVIDDSSVDNSMQGGRGMSSMYDNGLPSSDADGGTNLSSSGDSADYGFSTNGLWLQITGVTNDVVSLNLNNATDMVYEVFSTASLTNPVGDIEGEVWRIASQTLTPFTVAMQDRTNTLFLCARDWTGVTSNGNQIPQWWFWLYFGTVDLSDMYLDASGNTLLYDYQNGIVPTSIAGLGSPSPSLILIPSITNGYAPLPVSFTINESGLPGTVQSVAWDWQGDGIPDLVTSNLSSQSYIYNAGTYYPVVTVTTSQGTYSSGGGITTVDTNMEANPVTIVANILPQIVWSKAVADPVAVKANADGSVYVLTGDPPAVILYGSNGTILRTLDLTDGGLSYPSVTGFDVDANGNVYTAMLSDHQVMKWNPQGESSFASDTSFNNVGYIGNADMSPGIGNDQFQNPIDVAVSPDGTVIYVTDFSDIGAMPGEGGPNGRIKKFTSSGAFLLSITGFGQPTSVKADPTGRLFVADPNRAAIFTIVNDAVVSGVSELGALEASGDSMVLYVADEFSGVQQFDSYSFDSLCSVPTSIPVGNYQYRHGLEE